MKILPGNCYNTAKDETRQVIDVIDVIQIKKCLSFAINLTKMTAKIGFGGVFREGKHTNRSAPA
jgi:hypothetical protein